MKRISGDRVMEPCRSLARFVGQTFIGDLALDCRCPNAIDMQCTPLQSTHANTDTAVDLSSELI